jgi:hypothetical protein
VTEKLERPSVTTVYEAFQQTVKHWRRRPFLGTRQTRLDGRVSNYTWKTFSEVDEASRRVATGLLRLRISPTISVAGGTEI